MRTDVANSSQVTLEKCQKSAEICGTGATAPAGIERPKAADGTPVPIPNTADAGYFSEKAVEGLEQIGMDPHLAIGRQKHHEAPVPSKEPV